jgi:hypothetical protein
MTNDLTLILQRIIRYIYVRGFNDCWNWTGAQNSRGLGQIRIDGKNYLAHRLAYTIATGNDPGDLSVIHTCDNPACCNPSHLRACPQPSSVAKKASETSRRIRHGERSRRLPVGGSAGHPIGLRGRRPNHGSSRRAFRRQHVDGLQLRQPNHP